MYDISPRLVLPYIRRPEAASLLSTKIAFITPYLLSFLLFGTVTSYSPSISRMLLVAWMQVQKQASSKPSFEKSGMKVLHGKVVCWRL